MSADTGPTAVRPAPAADPSPPRSALDRAVADLEAAKDRWAGLPVERRIAYLRGLVAGTARVARGQVEAAAAAKGLSPDSPLAGEEWMGGPYITLRVLRLLIRSLESIRDHGRVPIGPADLRRRDGGQVAVRAFPLGTLDRLLYSGFSAEVWMQPEVTPEQVVREAGGIHLGQTPPPGRVALVLGAGNVASIGALDAIYKLFNEGQVVLLKLHPVNDYLRPFIEDAFAELIADGYLRTVSGGADEGDYLCRHPGVDEIHITGSDRTHDAIVWGPGAEGAARKARNEPRLRKRVTAELGNVSPMILLPGRWRRSDLRFQAENLATQMTQNAGFNCNATKVILTWEGWPQRAELLAELGRVLDRLPPRPAYYPGAGERYRRFLDAYPQAETFGERRDGCLQPALIPGLDHDHPSDLAFSAESFCAVTAETPLPAADERRFLERAVAFCNERLWGTLNAGLVVDPETRQALGGALEEAVAGLRYGSVAINHWPAISYALGSTTWGAYPGHTPDDVQSGIGVVHNALLLERPEKSVVDGPFRVFPKPPWFATHGHAHRVAEHLVRLEATGSLLELPGLLYHALRG